MNIQQKINLAVLQHAPVSDLREILKAEKAAELARELEVSHANAMDVRSLMSALSSLMERVRTDPLAKKLAADQEAADLEQTHLAMGRLLRELQS